MSSLFSKPKIPKSAPTIIQTPDVPTPPPTRLPTETDESVLDAEKRTRAAAMRRRGRLSTILTDQSTMGSTGGSLGA